MVYCEYEFTSLLFSYIYIISCLSAFYYGLEQLKGYREILKWQCLDFSHPPPLKEKYICYKLQNPVHSVLEAENGLYYISNVV